MVNELALKKIGIEAAQMIKEEAKISPNSDLSVFVQKDMEFEPEDDSLRSVAAIILKHLENMGGHIVPSSLHWSPND